MIDPTSGFAPPRWRTRPGVAVVVAAGGGDYTQFDHNLVHNYIWDALAAGEFVSHATPAHFLADVAYQVEHKGEGGTGLAMLHAAVHGGGGAK